MFQIRKASVGMLRELFPVVNVNDGESRWMNAAGIASAEAARNFLRLDLKDKFDETLFELTELIWAEQKKLHKGEADFKLASEQGENAFMLSPQEYRKQLERQESAGKISNLNQMRLNKLRAWESEYLPMVKRIADWKAQRIQMTQQKIGQFRKQYAQYHAQEVEQKASEDAVIQVKAAARARAMQKIAEETEAEELARLRKAKKDDEARSMAMALQEAEQAEKDGQV
jgi:hypothetical protein